MLQGCVCLKEDHVNGVKVIVDFVSHECCLLDFSKMDRQILEQLYEAIDKDVVFEQKEGTIESQVPSNAVIRFKLVPFFFHPWQQ
jgi:hypothetical protein